jgi:hypothetical protein
VDKHVDRYEGRTHAAKLKRKAQNRPAQLEVRFAKRTTENKNKAKLEKQNKTNKQKYKHTKQTKRTKITNEQSSGLNSHPV